MYSAFSVIFENWAQQLWITTAVTALNVCRREFWLIHQFFSFISGPRKTAENPLHARDLYPCAARESKGYHQFRESHRGLVGCHVPRAHVSSIHRRTCLSGLLFLKPWLYPLNEEYVLVGIPVSHNKTSYNRTPIGKQTGPQWTAVWKLSSN